MVVLPLKFGDNSVAGPSSSEPSIVSFGTFELDLCSGELRKSGVRVALQEQPFRVLARLLACPGDLVTREELRQELWPSDTFVDFEHGLNAALKRLRDTLRDSAENPRFIETVPRRGYRFIAPVAPTHAIHEIPARVRWWRSQPPGWPRWWMGLMTTALVAALAAWSLLARNNTTPDLSGSRSETPLPVFTQLTFRHGTLEKARFAPDGETVVYSAAWDGEPGRLFTTRIGGRESRDLGIEGWVLNVSSSGDVAVKIRRSHHGTGPGVLGRVSLSGGAPRELLENVWAAAWGPDGRDLAAVVHNRIDGRTVIEYPLGRVLYRPPGFVGALCVLPDGGVALFECMPGGGDRPCVISLVNGNGARRVLSDDGWVTEFSSMAWSASTNEIFFSSSIDWGDMLLYAVTTSGRTRVVARGPGDFWFEDVDRRGRILMTRMVEQGGVLWLAPGETQERDVSWLQYSSVSDLSADGRLILLLEQGGDLGAEGGIGVRTTDRGPVIDLGRGVPLALSPDGRRVLTLPSWTFPNRLVVIPVGAGERRELRPASISRIFWGTWLGDGRRLIVVGGPEAHRARLYFWDPESGTVPQPISDEGTFQQPVVAPNGLWVTAARAGMTLSIYPIGGGTPRTVPGGRVDDQPLRWSADSNWLFVRRGSGTVALIERLEVATGRRSLWKELRPTERAGLHTIGRVVITPDGSSYAYTVAASLGSLYLVEGLR